MNFGDIAVVLDCAEGTVKVHLRRARQGLVRHLDLAGGAWRAIKNGPNGIWPSTMAWTGREVLMFAGSDSRAKEVNGARYDPRTGRWRAIDSGGLEWRGGEAAVWAGSGVIVWGGDSGIRITRDGGDL
jgi:hypothetical protein